MTVTDQLLRVELITPELASRYLEHNNINRPLRDRNVKKLARAMEEGKWMLNGDPIKFDTNGDISDGQHRLWAVIESGMAVEFEVRRGVPPEAFRTYGENAPRTARDNLAVDNYRYGDVMAPILRRIIKTERGNLHWRSSPDITNDDVLLMARRIGPAGANSLETFAGWLNGYKGDMSGLVRRSAVGFAGYMQSFRYGDEARDFVERVATGLNVQSKEDPVYHLRSRLVKESSGPNRIDTHYELALVIKASNKALAGERIKTLRWIQTNEDFPVPDGASYCPFIEQPEE